jgi:hypothetical protein
MLTYSSYVATIALLGLTFACHGDEFKSKKVDHDLILKNKIYAWNMAMTSLQGTNVQKLIKALPEGAVSPKTKLFFTGNRTITSVLVYKSSSAVKVFDRVIIDETGIGNFTNSPVLTLDSKGSAAVKILVRNELQGYRLFLINKEWQECDVALLPEYWVEGTVMLKNKPVRAVLKHLGPPKYLIIDTDGDGTFSINEMKESYLVTTYMHIGNDYYKVITGKSENDLDLEPFHGPFGQLILTGESVFHGSNVVACLRFADLQSQEKKPSVLDFMIQTVFTSQVFRLPAGTYGTCTGCLMEDGGTFMGFNVKYITLPVHGCTTLTLGKPAPDLLITQEKRRLNIQRIFTYMGETKVTYSVTESVASIKPLAVDVVDAGDPDKVLIGRTNMNYGEGNRYVCSVSIPETVKAGQKVLVRLQKGKDENLICKEFVIQAD